MICTRLSIYPLKKKRKNSYSFINNPEYKRYLLNFLMVKRISVYPKVSNSCMDPTYGQQDNRYYNDAYHPMTLELPQKQPTNYSHN